MNYFKAFKTAKATAGTTDAPAGMIKTVKDTVLDRSQDETTFLQKMGALLLFATAAWSIYVNIDSFNTFLVMFNEMFVTHSKVLAGDYLVASFVLGFGAVPLFALGAILRKGASGGSALKWGVIGLLTSVLAAIFWLAVIIMISVGIAFSPF